MANGFGLMIIDKKDKSINAHNIVTNSYSCGIGEQNQNALMMGNGNIVSYAERNFYNRRDQST